MPRLFLLTLILFVTCPTVQAQLPKTELYAFKVEKKDTNWIVHSPRLLSAFNPDGYTNQPAFITDDVLYVSVRFRDSIQNDIYALNLDTYEIEQVTRTPSNEYSPLLHPDGKSFSCVRQVEGDSMDQRVFMYPLDRSTRVRPVFSTINNIGYHAWVSGSELAVFLVTDPPTLTWLNSETGEKRQLISKIGRCMAVDAAGRLTFVHKYKDDYWYLKTLEGVDSDSEIVIQMPPGVEDFAVHGHHTYWTSRGSQLLVTEDAYKDSWRTVSDLSKYGISTISRIAMNGDGDLIVVSLVD